MFAPDVNVLIYAHREDEATHRAYRTWLERLVDGGDPFGLSVLVAVGFVRIVTNRKIFKEPTTLEVALAAIDQLASHPRCRILAPGADHYDRVAELCRRSKATGKLVADAQHAALAMAEGATWITRDGDFARFAAYGLRWEHLVFEKQ
jgi:toxin-antitoxin system PIN domain toxin